MDGDYKLQVTVRDQIRLFHEQPSLVLITTDVISHPELMRGTYLHSIVLKKSDSDLIQRLTNAILDGKVFHDFRMLSRNDGTDVLTASCRVYGGELDRCLKQIGY